MVHDAVELVEIAALLDQIAVRRVAFHLAIAETPGVAALGIEPDDTAGALANFTQAPVVRQIIIVARVAQHDHRGALVDRSDMVADEIAERAAEIRVRIDVDQVALERDVERLLDVVGAEVLGDLTDVGDEDEAAHARVQVLQRVDELQNETRGVAHRVRDVAQDYHLRLLAPALLEAQLERHAAVLQVVAQRALDIEAALLGVLAPHREHVLEALRQPRHRLLHAVELFVAQVVEALVGELVEPLLLARLEVALLALHPHVAPDDVLQRLQPAVEIFLQLGLQRRAVFELLDLLAQLADLLLELV